MLWLHVGTWNIDSLSGNGREVCEQLMVDVFCLQEVRWRELGCGILRMEEGDLICGGQKIIIIIIIMVIFKCYFSGELIALT